MGRMIPNEMVEDYCEEMEYTLEAIGKIAFQYLDAFQRRHALLKQAAVPNQWSPQWIQDKNYWSEAEEEVSDEAAMAIDIATTPTEAE